MPESDHKGEWPAQVILRRSTRGAADDIRSYSILPPDDREKPPEPPERESEVYVPRSQLDAAVEALEFLLSRFNLVLEGKRAPEVTHSILQAETALRAAALPTEQPEGEK